MIQIHFNTLFLIIGCTMAKEGHKEVNEVDARASKQKAWVALAN